MKQEATFRYFPRVEAKQAFYSNMEAHTNIHF